MNTRTSRADKNWLSWSGDTLQLYLGTDHPEICPRVPAQAIPPDPTEWDSALKISLDAGVHVYVENITAAQCRENVLDINHSHGVTFKNTIFGRSGETGEQVITIKGGSSGIVLNGVIGSKGTNATVVIGQWSDQSTALSRDIDLTGLYTADGSPITVIMARADRKTIKLPSGAKVLFWKSVAYTIYWWLKRAAVAIHLIG